ncbi:cytochrome c [Vibrio aquaticus]|uniref:Cytochrome c n=1 Tax=Vibrio aquaticus TaxID=2496559 RepID=A0A3S0PZG9_9VIBR|nr:cytochrome c [Vibrio aquaticus]RTZ13760.1 cytochrome c [Vibrio aquaticus]
MKNLVLIPVISLSVFSLTQANTIDVEKGEQNYKTLCIACHGEKGHGDGIAGKALSEKPSNINDGLNSWFESEAELIDTVLNGNEGMPAWKSILTADDVKDIFAYVKKVNTP